MSHLSLAQLQTLKAAIAAEVDAEFVAFRLANDSHSMAAWYNQPSTVYVWKTSVSKADIMSSPAFDWTRVDNLSVGKARIWSEMFSIGNINPSQANIRAGIDASWIGTAADLSVRAGVYTKCKRLASRLEALYTGAGTEAVPTVMGFEGSIDSGHIRDALEA